MQTQTKQASDRRVAVFFADGTEEVEALAVVDILFRAGIACDMVSITPELQITSSHNIGIVCNRSILDDDFDFEAYDMLVLPGGVVGTQNLEACEALGKALRAHAEKGKDLAAICAAPSIFAKLGLLKGVHATSNPGFQDVLVEHGAILEQERVVHDGNIITSQGMACAVGFALELVRTYAGEDVVDKVKAGIVELS